MATTIVPPADRLIDLSQLCELSSRTIDAISEYFDESERSIIKSSELRNVLHKILTEHKEQVDTDAIARILLSLYTLMRQRDINPKELLEGIGKAIDIGKIDWDKEKKHKWDSLSSNVLRLFSLPGIMTLVKALDLSYDYAFLYQNAKILTDIRPIFSDNANAIEGSVISFTLRLYYDSVNGSQNTSIALDLEDLEDLIENCKRAITKAKTAQDFMKKNMISKTFICGDES